tara:strand:+ start:735 stop:2336 length:1602 start_codon:yes stop_codon:yes gene_type:complete
MIESLELRQFVIVNEMSIDFANGLNVVTGETGAGKSLIIKALSILAGMPAHDGLILHGQRFALLEATFYVPHLSDLLELNDDRVIISRKIQLGKPTINKVNFESVSVKELKRVASYLMMITSQHEVFSFMDKSTHYEYLDACIGQETVTLRQQYYDAFNQYTKLKNAFKVQKQREIQLQNDIVEFQQQINDISSQSFQDDEEFVLQNQLKEYKTLEKQQKQLSEIKGVIEQIDMACFSLNNQCDRFNAEFNGDFSISLDSALDALRSFELLVAQKHHDLSLIESIDLDNVNARLDAMFKYKQKYQVTSIQALYLHVGQLEEQIRDNQQALNQLTDLEDEVNNLQQICQSMAKSWRKLRYDALPTITNEWMKMLQVLGLGSARIDIQLTPLDSLALTGIDGVEFLFSANPNLHPKSLKNGASGGEISRVLLSMLACKKDNGAHPLIIFDEIDVGVGGEVANGIGTLFQMISNASQCLVITHLPQIARFANHHLKLTKSVKDKFICVKIESLNKDDVTHELQRMVGGTVVLELIQ